MKEQKKNTCLNLKVLETNVVNKSLGLLIGIFKLIKTIYDKVDEL